MVVATGTAQEIRMTGEGSRMQRRYVKENPVFKNYKNIGQFKVHLKQYLVMNVITL